MPLRSALLVFLLLGAIAPVQAGEFADAVEHYVQRTEAAASKEQQPQAQLYLRTCLRAVATLKGLEASDPRLGPAFDDFAASRFAAEDLLVPAAQTDNVKEEKGAFDEYLFPYKKAGYIKLLALQEQLLQRKYFKTQTAPNANFLEGYLNGQLKFTRVNRSDPITVLQRDDLGVSPWEVLVRLEPALVFDDGAQGAVIGTLGFTRTLFPEVRRVGGDVALEESFGSEWVRKWGVRLGAGAAHVDASTRFVGAAGVQVRALAIWVVYAPTQETFYLGVGTSDLSKIKKAIGWFD